MNRFLKLCAALWLTTLSAVAFAQANIEVDTPAINALKKSMQTRFASLSPYLDSGAVGLTRDGLISLRDANAVPLPKRAEANSLVAEENKDRAALYREIARANGKPEWEGDIKNTFGERWISRASGGWYYQNAQGQWVKK
jgi:uncharacterized protein